MLDVVYKLYPKCHPKSNFSKLFLIGTFAKEPRDGFALKRDVTDLFAHEGIKVIAVHDLAVLPVGQTSPIGEVDRFVLLTSKGHVNNLGQYGLSAEVIGSALPWCTVGGNFQG